jgi:hypothetical protein
MRREQGLVYTGLVGRYGLDRMRLVWGPLQTGISVARPQLNGNGRAALLTKRTKPSHDPEQNVVLFLFDQSTE